MSLINDALKRAKASQRNEQDSPTPPLQFRPVDPGQKTPKPFPWFLVICVGAALVIGLFLLKQFGSKQPPLKVEAKAVRPAGNTSTNEPTPVAASTKAVLPPAPKPTTFQPRTQDVVAAISPAPAQIAPPPLKLQGVFYSPTRPSAMIGGKTVFVGDKVGEFRITAIGRDSATLISATQTNVLTFEE